MGATGPPCARCTTQRVSQLLDGGWLKICCSCCHCVAAVCCLSHAVWEHGEGPSRMILDLHQY